MPCYMGMWPVGRFSSICDMWFWMAKAPDVIGGVVFRGMKQTQAQEDWNGGTISPPTLFLSGLGHLVSCVLWVLPDSLLHQSLHYACMFFSSSLYMTCWIGARQEVSRNRWFPPQNAKIVKSHNYWTGSELSWVTFAHHYFFHRGKSSEKIDCWRGWS